MDDKFTPIERRITGLEVKLAGELAVLDMAAKNCDRLDALEAKVAADDLTLLNRIVALEAAIARPHERLDALEKENGKRKKEIRSLQYSPISEL